MGQKMTYKKFITILIALCVYTVAPSKAHALYSKYELDASWDLMKKAGYVVATDGMNRPIYAKARFDTLLPKVATSPFTAPLAKVVPIGAKVGLKGMATSAARYVPYVGLGITAYMAYSDIKDILSDDPANQTLYPNVYAATQTDNIYDTKEEIQPVCNNMVGCTILINGVMWVLDSIKSATPSAALSTAATVYLGGGVVGVYHSTKDADENYYIRYYAHTTTLAPPTTNANDEQISSNLGGVNGSSDTQTSELVEMAVANPDKVQIPDSYDISKEIYDIEQEEADAKDQEGRDAIEEARRQYQELCDANPTSEYCAKAKEKEAELAIWDKEHLEPEAPPDEMPTVTSEDLKDFDWSAMLDVQGALANTFPFKQIMDIPDCMTGLCTDPVAPSFELPIYGDIKVNCDLAMFNPIATCFRWIFGIFVTIGGIIGAVRFYRGVA